MRCLQKATEFLQGKKKCCPINAESLQTSKGDVTTRENPMHLYWKVCHVELQVAGIYPRLEMVCLRRSENTTQVYEPSGSPTCKTLVQVPEISRWSDLTFLLQRFTAKDHFRTQMSFKMALLAPSMGICSKHLFLLQDFPDRCQQIHSPRFKN